MKKISIITVSYNSEKTIRDTIESVVNQNYKNIEYIIVDGKSTDGTVNIIEEYAKKYPNMIKYVSEKDSGIYDAMNKGLRMATGDIIGIVNSDDYYEDDALNIIAANAPIDELYVIYGGIRLLENNQEERCVIYNHNFLEERMIMHPACFVSKSVYDKYGYFDTNLKVAADYDFFLRINKYSDVAFYPIYRILSNFRCDGVSKKNYFLTTKETNYVKYKHNCISKKMYFMMMAKYYVRFFIFKVKSIL